LQLQLQELAVPSAPLRQARKAELHEPLKAKEELRRTSGLTKVAVGAQGLDAWGFVFEIPKGRERSQ
jgi:hypothetical protein